MEEAKRLVTVNEIIGQMARWAVVQHPYQEPVGLFDVCAVIRAHAGKDFDLVIPSLPMRWFSDSNEIYHWLRAKLWEHPTIREWNKPRSGHTASIVFSSRYDGPAPEDDFIDIDALLGNVAREAWKASEDCGGGPTEPVFLDPVSPP